MDIHRYKQRAQKGRQTEGQADRHPFEIYISFVLFSSFSGRQQAIRQSGRQSGRHEAVRQASSTSEGQKGWEEGRKDGSKA
jgi:hypothetical protein